MIIRGQEIDERVLGLFVFIRCMRQKYWVKSKEPLE